MIKGSLLCSVPIVKHFWRKFLSPKMGRKFEDLGVQEGKNFNLTIRPESHTCLMPPSRGTPCDINVPGNLYTAGKYIQWATILSQTLPIYLHSFIFLPARLYASAGNSDRNVSVCPSVRLSVCLSRAGIVSKRRKLAARFLHLLVATRLQFSDAKFHHQILRGSPRTGGLKQGSVRKDSAIFQL